MKSLFAASLLALGTTSAMAQATYTDQNGDEYTFNKHWFLDLQGGAQYTLGEAKFGDLLSPNVQLGLGYQFSPVFGMRLQANGWQSKGGWAGFRAQKGETPYNAQYKYKYVAPGFKLQKYCGIIELFQTKEAHCHDQITAGYRQGADLSGSTACRRNLA